MTRASSDLGLARQEARMTSVWRNKKPRRQGFKVITSQKCKETRKTCSKEWSRRTRLSDSSHVEVYEALTSYCTVS